VGSSDIEVRREPIEALPEQAAISIAFDVESELVLVDDGALQERPVRPPWRKDYDALDGGPVAWRGRYDTSSWQLFGAYRQSKRIGGAVAFIESTTATLWDLRVAPTERRSGAATALFEAVVTWARERGAQGIEVETQNINVPACRFYVRMGCDLKAVERDAYLEQPGETRLTWSRAC
jgi:GNAT superfamily N-acetyltransferase